MDKVAVKTFKDLVVWQVSHELALEIFKLSKSTKKTSLNYEILRQALRSAFSVPANIVEGFYTHRGKSYVSFLEVARGSAGETLYWVLVLEAIGDIPKQKALDISLKYEEVIKMLSRMINVIAAKS